MLEVTKEELSLLPRWARMAFAARCAQRVGGLFRYYWKDAPKKHVAAVERAVKIAVHSATCGIRVFKLADAESAFSAADIANNPSVSAGAPAYVAAHSVMVSATFALDNGDAAVYLTPADAAADDAADAAVNATRARNGASQAAKPVRCEAEVRNAQRYDFLTLKRLTEVFSWNDDSPVDPDLGGPIWPEGIPEKWPLEDPDDKNRKQGEFVDLTFDLPTDVDDETAQQLISELYKKLNDHYVAHGGSGLVLDNFQAFEPQHAEVLS
jgi:hypothetical protein